MNTFIEILRFLGAHYSPEQYLFMTKIQCLLWTAADLVVVFYLLQIANLARTQLHLPKHLYPYIALGVTVFFVPLVPIAQSGAMIFRLELLITVPHFVLILYVLAANMQVFPEYLAAMMNDADKE